MKIKKKKISIIGGSGFVGTFLSRKLLTNNFLFEIIDIRPSEEFPNHFKFGDVRDIQSLRKTISGELVINLAAVHRDDITEKSEYYETNVGGACCVSQVCEEKGIEKIIFTSSVAVYGFSKPQTDESGEINPFNEYGKSKFQAEQQYRDWQKKGNNKLIIIRPTVIFGEGNRGNVYQLFKQIVSRKFVMVGTGENIKSLAYVENIVAFLLLCIELNLKNELYNYIDKPNLKIYELLKIVYNIMGYDLKSLVKIPYSLAVSIGYLMDLIYNITGLRSPISKIRIKKFVSNTEFTSSKKIVNDFVPPFTLTEGLKRTLNHEFILKKKGGSIFFSE